MIWALLITTFLLGICFGAVFAGSVESNEARKEILVLRNDLRIAYKESEKLREKLYFDAFTKVRKK